MVDISYPEKIKSRYGADTDVYRVRVLGEFPQAGEDTIIPLSKVMIAVNADTKLEDGPDNLCEIGVDVARFGSDETVIYMRYENKVVFSPR